MSDEVRTMLRERAEVTDELGPAARVDAVHGRVRAVRRRRRGVVTAAAVAAVVAAGASVVPTLRPTPHPADQHAPDLLAGRPVPQTQTAAGFSYHYVQGVQSRPGAARLRLTVHAAATPKLVMWATSSTNRAPVVSLTSNGGGAHFRSAAGGFERYMLVGPGGSERLTLTQQDAPAGNRLALAVYALDRTPPPGVSNGAVTFRRTILDDRLVSGLIGKPGQTDLRTTIGAVHGPIRISTLCYGAGGQDYVHVSFNGRFGEDAAQCGRRPYFDAGTGGYTPDHNFLPAQGPIRVHVWVTGEHGSPPSETGQAVIGFGLYRLGGATFALAGQRVAEWQERDGHVWVHTFSQESSRGARSVTVKVTPSDVPRLVTIADSGYGDAFAMTTLLVDGVQQIGFEDGTGSGGTVSSGYVIQPGEAPTLTLRVHTDSTAHTVLGIALSDQVR